MENGQELDLIDNLMIMINKLSILTQLSFYVNANAETLREKFVAHEGQKRLTITTGGSIDTVDHGDLATLMTGEMQANIVDEGLREWVLPDFTTTTRDDICTASVVMMGTMQKYFSYEFQLVCRCLRKA